eukprot:SAG22_NODE_692_length_7878_cov_6.834812_8_plen_92_part_00
MLQSARPSRTSLLEGDVAVEAEARAAARRKHRRQGRRAALDQAERGRLLAKKGKPTGSGISVEVLETLFPSKSEPVLLARTVRDLAADSNL